METVLGAIREKDPVEMLERFVAQVLPLVLPTWSVGEIETYIQGNLQYPYTHMMLWESQRPAVAVHHPLLDELETSMAQTAMLVYGMNCRAIARVRLADHPKLVNAVRVELAVFQIPVGHPEKVPLKVTAVVPVKRLK